MEKTYIQKAFDLFDAIKGLEEQYPQTYDSLEKFVDYIKDEFEDPFTVEDDNEANLEDLAYYLTEDDKDKEMHPEVAKYLIDYFTYSISQGSGASACTLGAMYYNGRGVEKDYLKAIELYELSASRGNVDAVENLGYCYYYGRDGKVDYKKAFEYFTKASVAGSLNATYKIGDMYKNGYYVEKDENWAFRVYDNLYSIIMDADDDIYDDVGGPLLFRVAECYHNGIGVKKDEKIALHYYNKAEMLLIKKIINGGVHLKGTLRALQKSQNEAKLIVLDEIM